MVEDRDWGTGRTRPLEAFPIAVLGAGTMGPTISAAFAAAGHSVRLWARRPDRAQDGATSATRLVEDLVDAGLAGRNPSIVVAGRSLHNGVSGAALVVEAVSEDATVKAALLAAVEPHVPDDALIASTTSGLDVDAIAAAMVRPERALALHFWNPAHLMPLVEVAGGSATSAAVVEAGCDVVRAIGKRPVVVRRVVPGFIGTRLQQAVVREAVALLAAGVADVADIDAATRLGFGARFPVLGPLETSDLGGLDVVAAIHDYLLPDLDVSTAPQPLLRELVAAGRTGAKQGHGFYDWGERDAAALIAARDAELVERVRKLRASGELPAPQDPGGGAQT